MAEAVQHTGGESVVGWRGECCLGCDRHGSPCTVQRGLQQEPPHHQNLLEGMGLSSDVTDMAALAWYSRRNRKRTSLLRSFGRYGFDYFGLLPWGGGLGVLEGERLWHDAALCLLT